MLDLDPIWRRNRALQLQMSCINAKIMQKFLLAYALYNYSYLYLIIILSPLPFFKGHDRKRQNLPTNKFFSRIGVYLIFRLLKANRIKADPYYDRWIQALPEREMNLAVLSINKPIILLLAVLIYCF